MIESAVDFITILEEDFPRKETMALEVVTDGKTDKTEKEWLKVCTNKKTRDCVLCAAFFKIIKCILSCAIKWSK